MIATPEYNSSIPGVLKNALDWASRPLAESPVRNKPVAVLSSSTGMFGGVWAAAETRKVLGALGARTLEDTVAVPKATSGSPNGVDATLLDELRTVVDALATAVEAASQTRPPPRRSGKRSTRPTVSSSASHSTVCPARCARPASRSPSAAACASSSGRTGCTTSRRARAASGSEPARTAAAPRHLAVRGDDRALAVAVAEAAVVVGQQVHGELPATSSRGAVVSTLSS
jgi:hypothetical protein